MLEDGNESTIVIFVLTFLDQAACCEHVGLATSDTDSS